MNDQKFRRSPTGQLLTVTWPSAFVAAFFIILSAAASSSPLRTALLLMALGSIVTGVALARRICLIVTNDGLIVRNYVQARSIKWPAVQSISVRQIPILAQGGTYGLVVQEEGVARPIVIRASMLLRNRDKQRLLDTLKREASMHPFDADLPDSAMTLWVGLRPERSRPR